MRQYFYLSLLLCVCFISGIGIYLYSTVLFPNNNIELYSALDKRIMLETGKKCMQPLLSESKPQIKPHVQVLDVNKITVFSWNIYKQQILGWQNVLEKAVNESDLVLLQEAQEQPELETLIRTSLLNSLHAFAFQYQNRANGVMILSKGSANAYCVQLHNEPLIRFPKAALFAIYPLSNGKQLMVINVHFINFTLTHKAYIAQLNDIAEQIKLHQGPIVLAGDFNTWNQSRLAILQIKIKELGLKEVKFKEDNRRMVMQMPLDYMFIRGLSVKASQSFITPFSDHNPLIATFSSDD